MFYHKLTTRNHCNIFYHRVFKKWTSCGQSVQGTHFKSSGGYHWAAQRKVSWSHSPKPSSHSDVQSRRKAWSTPAESPARSVTCPQPTQRYRPPAPPQALIKAPEFHKEKTRKEARNPTTGIIILKCYRHKVRKL